jgi:hypothetical protein
LTAAATSPLAKAHVVNEMRVLREIGFAGNVDDDCADGLSDLRSRPDALLAFERLRRMKKQMLHEPGHGLKASVKFSFEWTS